MTAKLCVCQQHFWPNFQNNKTDVDVDWFIDLIIPCSSIHKPHPNAQRTRKISNMILLCFIFFILTFHTTAYNCPNRCSGHGTCQATLTTIDAATSDSALTTAGVCTCDAGYIYPDCSSYACPSGAPWFSAATADNTRPSDPVECSGIGHCEHKTYRTIDTNRLVFSAKCICPQYATGECCSCACGLN